MVGARYCSSPSVVIGIRIAAAPKQISGTAVTSPVLLSRTACPTPWLAKSLSPVADSHRM